jgi:hypothetical protein
LLTRHRERVTLRRELRRKEVSPAHAHALVIIGVVAMVAVWALGTLILRSLAPAAEGPWTAGWGMAGLAFATTVGLPGSYVAALLLLHDLPSQVAGALGAAGGMAAGALVAHTIGGKVRSKLESWEQRGRWTRAFLRWTEKAEQRWGYVALGVFLAIPGLPDSVPVYVFSLGKLQPVPFLAAAFAGSLVRSAITLAVGMEALRQLGLA